MNGKYLKVKHTLNFSFPFMDKEEVFHALPWSPVFVINGCLLELDIVSL
jgi:hypothetical protein